MTSNMSTSVVRPAIQLEAIAPAIAEIRFAVIELLELMRNTRKDYYSIEEVAAMTSRTPYTIRRWVKEGRVLATRVSGTGPRGRLLIRHDQLAILVGTGNGSAIRSAALQAH